MTQPSEKQQVITRLGQLKAERASWWAHWQEITLYLLPRNGRYFAQDRNKGWKRHNNIYDNTGTRALRTLAAGLMGGQQQAPQMPNLPPPPPPPQPEKMPNLQGLLSGMNGAGQAGGAKGVAQTFLTGASGVDPNALKLNKPTLLGE